MKKILFFIIISLSFYCNGQSITINPNTTGGNTFLRRDGIGLSHQSLNGAVKVGTYVTSSAGYIQTHSNHNLYFSTNSSFGQMGLTTNGNVGIGTIEDPITRLDVNGPILTRNRIVLGNQNGNNPNTNPVWVIDNFNNDFRLFQQPTFSAVGTVRLTVQNSTGNISIGTTSSYSKLFVFGTGEGSGGFGGYNRLSKSSIIGNATISNENFDAIGVTGGGNGANGSNSYRNIGIMGTTGNSGVENIGVYSVQNEAFSVGQVYGVKSEITNSANASSWGMYSAINGTGGGNRYGVFSVAYGTGSNYAVYAHANNGISNLAGAFAGNVTVNGTFSNPSDEKFKKNLLQLDNALDKVMALNPSTYEYKTEEFAKAGFAKGKHFGFTAQVVQNILPQLISENTLVNPDSPTEQNPTKYLSVNYIEIIPILTKAIQEQQAMIKDLQAEILKLKK